MFGKGQKHSSALSCDSPFYTKQGNQCLSKLNKSDIVTDIDQLANL